MVYTIYELVIIVVKNGSVKRHTHPNMANAMFTSAHASVADLADTSLIDESLVMLDFRIG
jgi:hypothetical protein